MIDAHIHIGQFYEIWYDPEEVIQTVLGSGVEKLVFSSTSSCKENVQYSEIEKEITPLLGKFGYGSRTIVPLLWYLPEYYNTGLTIEKAMQTLPYGGIKIHPRAQNWDMSDKKILSIADELFDYANRYKLPVLIHTGYDKIDEAENFSRYFSKYPDVKFVLAHCRPPDQVLRLLLHNRHNRNVFFDTAFVPEKDVQIFLLRGLGDQIILGSDFPITHYFNKKQTGIIDTIEEQYKKDIQVIRNLDDFSQSEFLKNTNYVYFNGE
jgi:hypothetical protein